MVGTVLWGWAEQGTLGMGWKVRRRVGLQDAELMRDGNARDAYSTVAQRRVL